MHHEQTSSGGRVDARAPLHQTRASRLAVFALFAAGLVVAPGTARAVTETYTFHDTLTPVEGAGNVMVPVYNSPGSILTSGGSGFVNGSFVTQTISPTACAAMPTVRSWSFPARGGLRYLNATPAVVTGSYTVSILVRFNPLSGAWARLIDFSNSTLDTGIYEHNGGVGFYPVGDYAAGSFVTNRDTFVTITRNGTSRLVSLYINGNAAGTYTDTGNLYAPSASVLYLFMDNTTGSANITEANAGVVSYIQISDAPFTAAEVTASLASICGSIACGDGTLQTGEGCDPGAGGGSTTCTAGCRIPTGRACNATSPGLTGGASCVTGLCDTTNYAAPGRCAQCVTSAQCSGATPSCNTTTNLCVACNAPGASACGGGTVCITSGAMAGQCGPCTADAQCSGATPACDPITSRCAACTIANPGACSGATPVCAPATNTCVACSAVGAIPCATGTTCSTTGSTAGRCVQCSSNSGCSGSTPACDTSTGACRGCSVASQSSVCGGSTSACNPTTGACVAPSVTITAPADGAYFPSGAPSFSGTATPGQTVTITIDGVVVGTVVAGTSGAWTFAWPAGRAALTNGAHTANISITTGSSPTSVTRTINVGCGASSDCSGATPVCDTTARVCVQCLNASQCTSTRPVCASNACRACAVATQGADCPASATSACNGATGACVAPTVTLTAPANGSASGSGSPTLSGAATPGQTVTVTVDGAVLGTVIAGTSGAWMLAWPAGRSALANGSHTATAAVTAGSTVSAMSTFTVGCVTNASCSGSTPICATATSTCRACAMAGMTSTDCAGSAMTPFCSGAGATSGQCVAAPPRVVDPANSSRTALTRPTVRGTAPANGTVQVFIDGTSVGTAVADASGNFSFVPATALSVAMHTVAAANVVASVVGPTGTANTFTVTGCTAAADCSGSSPICDATSRACRACNPSMASDCAVATPLCSTSGASAGMCVASVPTITAPTEGARLASRRPEVRGTAVPSGSVSVLIDGAAAGRATVSAAGTFTFTPTADLALGAHTVAAALVAAGGDGGTTGAPGPSVRFTLVGCATAADCSGGTPICDASGVCRACDPMREETDCPDDEANTCAVRGPDQGRCVEQAPVVIEPAEGSRTLSRRPVLSGLAAPTEEVAVRIDGMEVGRGRANFMAMWTVSLSGDLSIGEHTVTAQYVYLDGSLGTVGQPNRFTVLECGSDVDCIPGRCDVAAGRCMSIAVDGGTPTDAGGTVVDAAVSSDAPVGSDAGVTTPDVETPDAGSTPTMTTPASGCGCRVGDPSSTGGRPWLALAALALVIRRRRQR